MNNHHTSSHLQQGGALIILMLLLVLAGTAALLTSLDSSDVKIERERKTAIALAEAKAALIGYATIHQRPGTLPCPDTNNDGTTDTNGNVSCYSNIGRLPWKSLGLGDIRDGNGDRIWYSLSSNFAAVPSGLIINSDDTVGLLNVCPEIGCGDASPIPPVPNAPLPIFNQQVAIVFSSGGVLAGQSRVEGVDPEPNPAMNVDDDKKSSNFLDAIVAGANQFNNATGSNNGNDFILGVATSTFNDRLLAISTNEIFDNVNKRMKAKATLAGIASCLIEYANYNFNNPLANDKRLPWSTSLILANYNDAVNFDDAMTRYTGRVAYHIADSTAFPPVHDWDTGVATKKRKMAYCSSWPVWWDSWKNRVFYAVSKDFSPDTTAPQICSGNCVTVDGVGPFAAVLIYSGEKLAGQVRINNVDMANPANFLEGSNAIEVINNTGYGNFTAVTGANQNDVAICIRQNLTIDKTCAAP